MEPKFHTGDRVIVLGHPSGRLSTNSIVDMRTGANYIRSMDNNIGKEFIVHHFYKATGTTYQDHYRYRLENDSCYWIEDWLDFAEPPVNYSHLEIANLL